MLNYRLGVSSYMLSRLYFGFGSNFLNSPLARSDPEGIQFRDWVEVPHFERKASH